MNNVLLTSHYTPSDSQFQYLKVFVCWQQGIYTRCLGLNKQLSAPLLISALKNNANYLTKPDLIRLNPKRIAAKPTKLEALPSKD